MAQSALTVTPPSPSPPTNLACTGATPPNPGTFDLTTAGPHFSATGDQHYPRANLAPYFDDGINTPVTFSLNDTAASKTAFIANTAAFGAPNTGATSIAAEGAGTEASATAPGSPATAPLVVASAGPTATSTPNLSHASYLSGSTVTPTITGAPAPNNVASGAGTSSITLTGTGYTRASVVFIGGVAQGTQYVSATSLVVPAAPKRLTAGTSSVTVVNGVPGGVTSAAATWTFT